MKPLSLFFSAVLLAATLLVSGQDDTIYLAATATDELSAKEGQKVTVYGTTAGSGKSASGTNFVNFKGAEFYLVTFKSDLTQFEDGDPADLYDDKRIAVSGVVSVYQGKPQFKLTSPDQVEILAKDEVFPPTREEEPAAAESKPMPKEKPVAEAKRETEGEAKKKPPVDPKKYFK